MMKKNINLLVILSIILFAPSCISAPTETLPPLNIEIPSELNDNQELVDFIKNSEKDINDLTINLEQLAEDTRNYIHKEAEDLSTMEKVKFVAAVSKFSIGMMETTASYQQMLEKSQLYEKSLSEDEILALETVMNSFKKRMEEINNKYEAYNENI